MTKPVEPKYRKQPLGIPGYGRGVWWLVAVSAVVLFALLAVESNRAISSGIGLGSQVQVERIPAEEAKRLGISPKSR
ncbi:MAG: hypothetical protein KGP28_01190 [Bdellovibrionales bacterium]|nr:hypothetical protein [Bdellovibrionales bacterium]